jgi:hypothetical protein
MAVCRRAEGREGERFMIRFVRSKRLATNEASRRTAEASRELAPQELDAVAGAKMKRLLNYNRRENESRRNGGWTGTGAGGSW